MPVSLSIVSFYLTTKLRVLAGIKITFTTVPSLRCFLIPSISRANVSASCLGCFSCDGDRPTQLSIDLNRNFYRVFFDQRRVYLRP